MNDDLPCTCCETVTNDFVTDLKNLSLSLTEVEYKTIIERLHFTYKHVTPKGQLDNLPFAMAFVDNFYRAISCFERKLADKNENAHETQLFLQTLSNTYDGVCLFDLFLAIKDTQCLESIFDRYFPLLHQNYFTDDDDDTYDNLVNCLLPIISYSCTLVILTEENLSSDFMSHLLKFLKIYWASEKRQGVVGNILTLLKITSKSCLLVPMLVRAGLVEISHELLTMSGPKLPWKNYYYISLTIQKLARHPIGVEALKKMNFIDVICQCEREMKNDYPEEEYNAIEFVMCMTYALITEADEIRQNSMLADGLMCRILRQLIEYTYEAGKNRKLIYRGCQLSDMLCVLTKLFANDDILTRCLKEQTDLFDHLCQFVLKFSSINVNRSRVQKVQEDEALLALLNLLWSISFHDSYHEKFKSNTLLMQTLSNLATSSILYRNNNIKLMPDDIVSLKRAAESILWNLNGSLHKDKSIVEQKQTQTNIMISYSHSDSIFCRELVDYLSQYITVWVDYKQGQHGRVQHSDDVWEEIAAAMETATAIVLILSKEYYDSKSCRQELSYASDTLKKRIIPIYAPNQGFKASGWLGIRIAGQKYVHFGRKSYVDACNELLSMINIDHKPMIPVETKPIEQKSNQLIDWTSKDVHQWFENNHVHQDLIALFAGQFHTGTALLVYAYHLKQFYRTEYIHLLSNYRKQFNGRKLQTIDFITFVDALWRLRQEYDPQGKYDDTWDKQLANTVKLIGDGTTWL